MKNRPLRPGQSVPRFAAALTIIAALFLALSAAAADYRSRANGDWSDFNTWQVDAGGGFVDATSGQTPTSADGTIVIRTNHTVTISSALTVDEVTVNAGGQLTITDNAYVTLADGPGTDLNIQGKLLISSTASIATTIDLNNSGATVVVQPNGMIQNQQGHPIDPFYRYGVGSITNYGTYLMQVAQGTVTTNVWMPGSTLVISPTANSGANYPVSSASLSGQTFHHVTVDLTNQTTRAGTSGGLTGDLTVNGDLTFLSTYKNTPTESVGATIDAFTDSSIITNGISSGALLNTFGMGIGTTLYDSSGAFIGVLAANPTTTTITLLTNAAVAVVDGSFKYVNPVPLVMTFGSASKVTIGGNLYVKNKSWFGLGGPNSGTQAGVWTLYGSLLADPNTLIESSSFGNRAGVQTLKFAGSGTISFPTNVFLGLAARIYGQYGIDASHGGTTAAGYAMAYEITGNYKLGTPWRLNFGGNPSKPDVLTITNNGTLDCGPYRIYSAIGGTNGNNSFTLSDGSTLGIGSAGGITTNLAIRTGTITNLTTSKAVFGTGTAFDTELQVGSALYNDSGTLIGVVASIASSTSLNLSANALVNGTNTTFQSSQGTIQVLGTKTYSPAANYLYKGAVAQVTGSSLPATVNSLTISNTAAAVTLSQDVTVTNLAVRTGANFNLNSKTVTTPNAPVLNGTLTMPFTKTGSGPSTFAGSMLNQTSGTLTYAGTLTVTTNTGTLPLVSGDAITLFNSLGGYSGSFSATNLPTLSAGQGWSTANLTVNGSVEVYTTALVTPSIHSANLVFSAVQANQMTLSWNTGNGANRIVVARAGSAPTGTPVDGTTYNVNAPLGNGTVVYNGPGDSFTATGLTAGTVYYFTIYEYNGSGVGSKYYTAGTPGSGNHTTLAAPPTTQASGVNFTSVTGSSMTINWAAGNGANRLVVVKAGAAVNSDPLGGTTYTANATFGSGSQIGTGNYVVYSGTGTSVTINGLATSTTYHVAVYEWNGSGITANYLVPSTATGSQQTVLAKYRSNFTGGGDWSAPATWQYSTNNGATWAAALTTPGSVDDTIEILANDNVTVTTAVTGDQMTINTGGTLTIAAGTLTLKDGAGATDLAVNGALVFSGAGKISLDPNAKVVVATGTYPNGSLQAGYTGSDAFTGTGYTAGAVTINGTYKLLKNNGVVSTCTWATGSTLLIAPTTSSANYPANAASLSSQTFYNVTFDLVNQTVRSGTGGGLTGNLTVNGDLTFLNTFNTNLTARTGTITASTASTAVTGDSTLFNTELAAGNRLYDGSGNFIGVIASITDATTLTLVANAAVNVSAVSYQSGITPQPLVATFGNTSTVTIGGNLYLKGNSWIGLGGPNGGTQAGLWILNGSLIADPNTLMESSAFGNRPGVQTLRFAGSGTITFPTNLYFGQPNRIYGQYGIDASHGAGASGGYAMAYEITGNYKLATPWRLNFGGSTFIPDLLTVTGTGTLDCGPYKIYSAIGGALGNNAFTVADGGTLGIGSAAGITTSLASRTGNITTSSGSKAVTGVGTAFGTELQVGSAIYDGFGTMIGVVAAITDNSNLSLSANALVDMFEAGYQSSQGTIQVLGTKTYSALANYIYKGTAAQVTGNNLPATVNRLTITNAAGVTLSQVTAVSSTLSIRAGTLTPSGTSDTADTLTFDGLTYQTSGTWGSTSSTATHKDNARFAGTGYVTVSNSGVGPSGPGYLTNSISGNTLSLSWPAGQSWQLQMQTNSLATGLSTNWVNVPGSASISSTNITVDPTKPTVFYRLIYP